MRPIDKEQLHQIAAKQSNVIKALHSYVFMNEAISEEEREFILANLNTVIRLY